MNYALTAGSAIERLMTADFRERQPSTSPAMSSPTRWGNYGGNLINGGAGADMMMGWKGNDTYIVDNPGDTVFENGDIHSTPENESEGFDTVLTT